MEKFGLMTYKSYQGYNVGDYVQSLAAEQYLPRVDKYINREELIDYNEEEVKMIMNGWYMHFPEKWPPSAKIDPLFVSFHLNSHAKDALLSEEGVRYFKQHEPIGCRDLYTKKALEEKGIKAYHSGCLTTTLDIKYKTEERTDNIYFGDVLFNVPGWSTLTRTPREMVKGIVKGKVFSIGQRKRMLESIFDTSLINKAIPVPHLYPKEHTEEQRFQLAKDILRKYAAAKLVVTSRIHSALPCLAMGTPVIFVKDGFFGETDLCRFEGIIDLFNTIEIDLEGNVRANFELPKDGKIDENFKIQNPTRHVELANKLKETCRNFVKESALAGV